MRHDPGAAESPASQLPFQIRIFEPNAGSRELNQLLRFPALTRSRQEYLRRCTRIVVACNDRIVGAAPFERTDHELRVHAIAVLETADCTRQQVTHSLLDAVETACLASGGTRVLLMPAAAAACKGLSRRGYVRVGEGCAGSWLEKTLI